MTAEAVYGYPPSTLAPVPADATQTSPLVIGATPIEAMADGAVGRFTILAPPGTLERRFVLAQGLRALAVGGELVVLALKNRGGARLAGELSTFGCDVRQNAKAHHRICRTVRPAAPAGLEGAIEAGGPRWVAGLGLWSQPGVFSWDRVDPGTALLLGQPWTPAGAGADLGCGIGLLALQILKSDAVESLRLIDIDARAIAAARRNIADPRASFRQHDLREAPATGLDFVVMNPPFHNSGAEDRRLGRRFVETAAAMLKSGGVLRMVANIALTYEDILAANFGEVRSIVREGGYKVLEGVK
ncbi:MAG TPA: methyltransferase [Caulobacteraceae bacterium]